MPMFGSIAAAGNRCCCRSTRTTRPRSRWAEAPPRERHPPCWAKDVANPLAMILACGGRAQARGRPLRPRGRATLEPRSTRAALDTVASGIKTHDLGGDAGNHGVHRTRSSSGSASSLAAEGHSRTCGARLRRRRFRPRPFPYSYEHMFQSSSKRSARLDEPLRGRPRRRGSADPAVDARARRPQNRSTWSAHPHPKSRCERIAGAGRARFAPAPAVCISPVRAGAPASTRRRAIKRHGDVYGKSAGPHPPWPVVASERFCCNFRLHLRGGWSGPRSCATCRLKIAPAGFAGVVGAWAGGL